MFFIIVQKSKLLALRNCAVSPLYNSACTSSLAVDRETVLCLRGVLGFDCSAVEVVYSDCLGALCYQLWCILKGRKIEATARASQKNSRIPWRS